MKRTLIGVAAAAVGSLALTLTPLQARELVYGSWIGPNGTANTIALPWFFDRVKEDTNGEIEWTLVAGGQLATGPGTVEAVASNLVDAGTPIASYTPRLLPATNVVFSTTLAGEDVVAAVGAMHETLLLDCPECLAEYKRNNAVMFGGYTVPAYKLLCREDLKTVDDLKGKKIRTSGGGVATITIAGATPVAMTTAEATSALERGVLDCIHGPILWLHDYGYMDMVEHIVDYPLGVVGPVILGYVNRDVWNSMTPEQRKAHLNNAAGLTAVGTINGQLKIDEEVKQKAKDKGITFSQGGEDFAAVMDQRVQSQRADLIAAAKDAGVKDPEAIFDTYMENYEKWKKLSADIGLDVDKYTEALQREVYSKLDPENL